MLAHGLITSSLHFRSTVSAKRKTNFFLLPHTQARFRSPAARRMFALLLLNEAGDYYSWNDQQKVIDARKNQHWAMWKDFHMCGFRNGGRSCHFGAFNDYALSKYYGSMLDICNSTDSSGCNGATTWNSRVWPGSPADWHTAQVNHLKGRT